MRLLNRQLFLSAFLVISVFLSIGCSTTPKQSRYHFISDTGRYELEYIGHEVENPAYFKALVNDTEIFVSKDAVVPSIQSIFLLENTRINKGDVVLDIGTGSGIQAIFAAKKAKKIVATDINPNSITSANFNAKYHGFENIIDVRLGDLFAPVKSNEKFDVIIYNIDYPYDVESNELWEVHERFFAKVNKYLKQGGTVFYQSGWIWNIPRILEMIRSNGFMVERITMAAAKNHEREPIVFELKYNVKQW